MPNWCSNSIAFYQENGGTAILEAFYADVQKYENFIDPETGRSKNWVGNWLIANRIDADDMSTRGFFSNSELNDDHVRIDMESAWEPLPEVWDAMAEKYELAYVYISEEPGMEIYVNTDAGGHFFSSRYILNSFDVDDLELDDATMAEYGERLRDIGEDTRQFDSFEEVAEDFKDFGFIATDLESLNKNLERFNIEVYEYDYE